MQFNIVAPDTTLAPALQSLIDNKTKPPGSLGRLERLALQIGLIQQTLTPKLTRPHIIVCAADHGAALEGVSAFPQEVTWQMVENYLAGGAGINVLARQAGVDLMVVDAGVNHDFGPRADLVDAKIAYGTASYIDGPAMTPAQCNAALERGMALAATLHENGCNVVGFGEMGIGNTASAALITSLLGDLPLDDCVGRGTGLDDSGLARKQLLLRRARERYDGNGTALSVLAHFGGFEIAMLCGAMLGAAQRGMVLLIDGFIITSALMAAARLAPDILAYCVFSHRSQERGHRLQLERLGVEPLLDLELRLGEGTGAALAYPIVASSVAILNEMASFESAGVAEKVR
ncbi:MAG: nicotinate-nucleotide--dimethylbenzimidazole phosphoribosyltransferase [Rhodocyclaceae bacterium]